MYYDIYWYEDKANNISYRFTKPYYIDPDICYYYNNWVEAIGNKIKEEANLANWVGISAVTKMPLGLNYIELDPFWQHAVTTAVNEYVKSQNEESKRSQQSFEDKLNDLRAQKSSFDGIPMPSFIGK